MIKIIQVNGFMTRFIFEKQLIELGRGNEIKKNLSKILDQFYDVSREGFEPPTSKV
jgi:hypothetical protein